MEYQTEFSLEKSIRDYIKKLNTSDILQKEDADEVFDHWMTESEELIKSGLNAREAFEIVKMRFGQIKAIEKEYFKSKPSHMLSQYLLGGILFYTILRLSVLGAHLLLGTFIRGNLSSLQVDILFFGKPVLITAIALSLIFFVKHKLLSKKVSIKKMIVPLILLLVGIEFIESFETIYFFSQGENFDPSTIYFWLGADSKFPMLMISICLLVITFFTTVRGNKNLSVHLAPE